MAKVRVVISCPMTTTVVVDVPKHVADDPSLRTEAVLREAKKALQRKLPSGVWQHERKARAISRIERLERR